ncbi:MAG TPA: cysteine--tRNA ligase [bacterium]|nr:cysteine--tRNA ligase [bacterium]
MPILVSNSLTRQLEEFRPLEAGKVKMYVCGPTVYGPSHIGHARTYIAFDVIRRYFEYCGYEVTFICNITDVHDDMIKRANERGITIFELADENIASYLHDMESLNVLKASAYPRVTEVIPEIIDLTRKLVESGYAYPVEDGSVYYDVAKFSDYGKLSGIRHEAGVTGTRVETDKYDKEHAQDFALWKGAKPGEPTWESPWGPGRPGWHIECSVMSQKYLGDTFDIHGGAIDLIFPHHENEIAQSEAANQKPFVRYFLHSGLLRINGEKMSKSLGNFIEIPDLLAKYDPMAVRFFLLQSHYKSSADFTDDGVQDAKKRLERWHNILDPLVDSYIVEEDTQNQKMKHKVAFSTAMDDDFNTPQAIAVIEQVLKDEELTPLQKKELILDFDSVLGLRLDVPLREKKVLDEQTTSEIEALVAKREEHRAAKQFAESDAVRDELKEKYGVVVEDTPHGSKWHKE